MREIHLDGGEITILKAVGLGGTPITGEQLAERVSTLEEAEMVDALDGLITSGYLVSDTQTLRTMDDVKRSNFHVNSGYARELKDALDPQRRQKPSRRVRRE
ncbi:MAG: hypothetical protein M3O82_05660 [Verrucomicrobiota bacterium]|nr:hypothetical protein [Verrucomicrobiota bacterium]